MRNNSNNNNSDTIFVSTKKVSCDGTKSNISSPEGHPLVYLNIGKSGSVVCPYCSRLFTINKNPSQVIIGLKNQITN